MTITALERTDAQRLEALRHANRNRTCRAMLKKHLKAGTADVLAILADPQEEVAGMKVFDLLAALPKIGSVRASTIMRRTLVSHAKTVGGLSDRQRNALIDFLAFDRGRRVAAV